ncbi:MAG: 4Fe-4S binding protein [Sedimentisphaerales bacterium]
MRFARGFLIFSYGLFTIAAQALLFREFLTTFEGNDISVGFFFSSWFLWVAFGAILVYRTKTFAETLLQNIEFLLLAFLPAFILQWILIVQARELAGIEPYTLWSIRAMLLLSLIINAPVSTLTGVFFPIACRWVKQNGQFAVSRVYIVEAAGSFLGGLGTTVLLGLGVSSAKIFFILAFVLSLSALWVQLAKSKRMVWAFLPTLVFVCLIAGADQHLSQQVRVIKWKKLLPEGKLIGSFYTAQAEYLYGLYQDQWVAVREGSTCEVLPDYESAGRIAAISLCQNPEAKRALVIGSGLGLCRQFLRLPQIETISWAHCDSEYVQNINQFIPEEFKINDQRFHTLLGDIRLSLAAKYRYYDIVIINLPDATSSVLNRYYTLEFYRQIKKGLRPNGVLAVRVAGGENIMGTELINLGASTKLTLASVFSKLVLVPGEDTWFIASDSEKITGEPGILRDRFATIAGGADVFPPQALLSVYLPDRASAAMDNYAGADLPQSMLINRDWRPLTHLYSLLLAAKQSGAPVTRLVKYLALAGPLVFVVPILVYIVLRAAYAMGGSVKTAGKNHPQAALEAATSFDSSFLIFSAGLVGIGVVIVLMYLYQTHFGSLYLYIGMISSLFMVGLTAGATIISYIIKRISYHASPIFVVIITHTLVLAAIAFWPAEQWTHLIFAMAFVWCGVCAGCYFPLAAQQLATSGFETGQVGSKLETADHIGASIGGLLTGLTLVPVLGANVTLFVFILLLLANVPLVVLRFSILDSRFSTSIEHPASSIAAFRLRRLGYILFGIGVSVILCSNLLASAAARLAPSLPQHSAQALAGALSLEQKSTVLRDSARKISYFHVADANDRLTGYIFSSEELAPEIRGFGGKINLAVYVDPNGVLFEFHIIRSNETPAYLQMLSQWRGLLNGRHLFEPQPFADVDAVTGATVSSKAILSALKTSGQRFATQILGHSVQPQLKEQARWANYMPDVHGLYLIAAFVLALIVTYRGGFWSRLVVLLLTLFVGGIVLNTQYSSEQIVTILSLHVPAAGLTGAFLFVVGMPLLVMFFGNLYCGYICPFGAAQELLSYVLAERFKHPITLEKMRKARFVKYGVLFIFIILFFSCRSRSTLATDPLISFFNLRFWQLSMLFIAAIALISSVFYTRFWCRYLCPAGAFLSLLNNVAILKRYLPAKRFAKCEFGLTAKDHLDCIYCDRCRYQPKVDKNHPQAALEAATRLLSRYFVAAVLVIAILVSTISISRFLQVIPTGLGQQAVSAASGGQPRDVDLQRVRTLIEQKRLSDREAEFYKKLE